MARDRKKGREGFSFAPQGQRGSERGGKADAAEAAAAACSSSFPGVSFVAEWEEGFFRERGTIEN